MGRSTADALLGQSLAQNLDQVRHAFGVADDLVVREFRVGHGQGGRAAALFIIGLVDTTVVDQFILRPLTGPEGEWSASGKGEALPLAAVMERLLSIAEVEEAAQTGQVLEGLLEGKTAILIEGQPGAILATTIGWKSRQMGENAVESVVRGSREAFIEELQTNVSAVRRRIRHPHLQVEHMKIGQLTRTPVAILYIDGIARPEVLQEVRGRLAAIKIDGILESGYIEELIEDHRWSPFPQIEHTERPDKVAGGLLEGRVAIVTDGTPAVLLVPTGLFQFLQASEDYYERYTFAIPIRLLRLVALFFALYLPALYVAVITYHQEVIPLELTLRVAASREGTPFPVYIEALLMETAFELLREASLRLPRSIGPAISIVGGLVIGDAAVRAGLVGSPMVIVVATTGIASFAIPAFNVAVSLRFLRYGIMTVAAVAGLPGITLAGLALTYHVASLRSFGMPYLSPAAPSKFADWKDFLVRLPWWSMRQRPTALAADSDRQPQKRSPWQRRRR